MQEMDPASLLFLPRGEYAPLHLDPVLFESVGDGVAFESLTIPTQGSTLPPTPEPLKGLKSLADHFDSYEFTGRKRNVDGGPPKRRLGKAKAWESDLELELDQRIQHIERPNIFDSFIDMQSGIPNTRDDGSLSTFTSDASYEESANSSSSHEKERDSDAYARWNRQSIFGSLSHPAATDSLSWEQSRKVKETAEIALEIPALTKRPRDILDEYLNHDAPTNMSQKTRMARIDDSTNVRKIGAKFIKMGSQQYQADSWRALGKPEQQDVAIIGSVRSQALQGKSSKPQLTWESCSKTGPIEQPDMPFVSPYITEAGTALFEAVYQKHTDYAFRFRPTPAIVSSKKLTESAFSLLGGTSSSIFTYNPTTMRFEMTSEGVRIQGCSMASISGLLQDLMTAGTHMRRLVHVADSCINHPEGMGLIRIAFGRSLSSYLTFLQGSVVSLQDSSEKRQMSVVELHHKTHDMTVILERLAHLCQCHLSQHASARFGFNLPAGPDLLTRIYEEILEQPVTSDPLWVALLLSFLDQASKPYRDILSRWLGITPSAHAGHERSQLSRIANARRLSTDMRRNGGSAIGVRRGSVKEAGDCLFSIFDAHLQQSLQGLDPFGEFFVESKHGWSWDGAEPIILGDPLDYEDEFRMHRSVKPAGFIDYRLAERVMEAGKELQILNEFESRHPLIAHDRNTDTRSNGLKWFYVRGDIAAHRHRYEKSRTEVLQALAMRLRSKGWVARRRTHRKQMQATKASASEQDQTYRLSVAADKMDMDAFPAEDQTSIDSPTLDLGLDPELQGFFSLSSGLGQSKEMSLACPDMMAFLLGPSSPQASLACSPKSSSPSEFSTVPGVTCSGTGSGSSDVYSCTAPTPAPARMRLENMAPLAVLAEQSLCDSIRARTSLVNTCVMSLYFHDLNLLGHFEVMERFMLMKDGQFVAKLSEALFLDETGLLNRCAVHAANEAGDGTAGASTTTARDRSSMASNASGGTTGASTLRRNMRLKWPPRSGELEMTLRAVLLECFQLSSNEGETLQQSTNSERSESESDVSDMDIEETDPDRSSKLLYRAVRRGKLRSTVNRAVDVHELEESLAFAVKEYDDMSKICQDANALEALDFLYLDYKAPRPLRLMLFTPPVFEKYTRLFTFQLRLARVDAALKHVYTQLRTRQKDLANLSLAKKDPRQNLLQVVRIELQLLHRFRFEAQHILDSLRGYIADVALGLTWQTFMNRLRDLQSRIEDRILFSETEAVRDDSSEDDGGKIIMDGLGLGQGDEELEDLADLQGYHDRVLDQMLLQALLKRKQAPILKVVHGILNSMLKLSQFVQQLPETDISSPPEFLDKDVVQKRIAKLQTLQEKFRSMCRMLVKVLKVLDERGTGTGGTNTATTMQTTATAIGVTSGNGNGQGSTCAQSIESEFLQQLLLRLDMSGFNSN